jgi:hypothetical protein
MERDEAAHVVVSAKARYERVVERFGYVARELGSARDLRRWSFALHGRGEYLDQRHCERSGDEECERCEPE